ncbi:CKLF-like MARVEL transmembrane domain-containing protein 8 isoform X1 [Mustela erminea]|uniref:CKLF-like MARVEL transmembrane domain-containing protein 8 isoform X1 n=1 Tax=Mustela erminea TaxID=36723 RepID=UPI00138700A0|nr:CKLF-like MARVEL transmembrane domain-containing protein 8 isoform X1 [Mustela erminea]
MEEPQRARSHTVTTTASSFAENFSTSSSSFAYDREFLRTLPGLLIVAEIVLGLLVWTLIAGTEYFRVPAFGWVMFVAVFYWVLTVFFLIIYITMTYTRIPQVPWTTVSSSNPDYLSDAASPNSTMLSSRASVHLGGHRHSVHNILPLPPQNHALRMCKMHSFHLSLPKSLNSFQHRLKSKIQSFA